MLFRLVSNYAYLSGSSGFLLIFSHSASPPFVEAPPVVRLFGVRVLLNALCSLRFPFVRLILYSDMLLLGFLCISFSRSFSFLLR